MVCTLIVRYVLPAHHAVSGDWTRLHISPWSPGGIERWTPDLVIDNLDLESGDVVPTKPTGAEPDKRWD